MTLYRVRTPIVLVEDIEAATNEDAKLAGYISVRNKLEYGPVAKLGFELKASDMTVEQEPMRAYEYTTELAGDDAAEPRT